MAAHPHRTPIDRRLAVALLLAVLLASPALAAPARAEQGEPGRLWLLRQYRVPGCEPMPRVPTVFNWMVRKALAIEDFIATSDSCGEVGSRGARDGWTYVFWSESTGTAVEKLVRLGQERFGVTALVARRPAESYTVRSAGYEAFLMIQLGGEQGPARIWATGDVASLDAEISVAAPGEIRVELESTTYDGRRCVSRRLLRPDEPPTGKRESLICQAGG